MKTPGSSFDYRSINDTINRALAQAGLIPAAQHSDETRTFEGEARQVHAESGEATHAAPSSGSEFNTRRFRNHAGTRDYKLYIPASYAASPETPAPLVLMLHGCTQTPDDFAAGTRMNTLAEQHRFLVAYPAQATQANKSRCWRWYNPSDQGPDRGEPAILAGIAREVASQHRIDPGRIFAAGLSAGGAMAVILAKTHPDLFAAIGVHSGLPYGAARDIPSAFAAMKTAPAAAGSLPMRTIVFHGRRDATVDPKNGAAVIAQATRDGGLRRETHAGHAASGRAYTRTVYADASGQSRAEHWEIDGAGHAWSGGSPQGSFTEAGGPDASAEMVRFFLA